MQGRGLQHLPPTRILIIGAGAVGQVYGAALQRAGAEVDVFVREKYRAQAEAGYRLTRIETSRRKSTEHFRPTQIFSSADDAMSAQHDQVWLCISTPALERSLLDSTSDISRILGRVGNRTIVTMQSGLHMESLIAQSARGANIIEGGITLLSWTTPLPSETVEGDPHIAYWVSGPNHFGGKGAGEVAGLLNRGNCAARTHPQTRVQMAFGSATLMPIIAAMEGGGWSFSGLRKNGWMKLGSDAGKQARAVTSAVSGQDIPMPMHFLSAPVISAVSFIAPVIAPLNIEEFLSYHFSKVRDQTERLLNKYIEDARRLQLPNDALVELRDKVFRR